MFKGSYTALITPFIESKVDYEAFESLIEFQIENGTHGLVPSGTTGESPTLNNNEHDAVIEFCIKKASNRVKIMAGTGSNSTIEAIERTQHAEKSGADAALIMTPYYNKPNQEGIYRHYEAIHNNSSIPIFLYNIPGRSIVDISDDTIKRLMDLPRIVGIKDATANLERPKAITEMNPDFIQFSGEDATAVDFNRLGGTGCISVSANVVPKQCSEIQELCFDNKFDDADKIQEKLLPLHDVMFCEPSPQPAKYAMSEMKMCQNILRLPLISVSEANKGRISQELKKLELI